MNKIHYRTFEDLPVWAKSHSLTLQVYVISSGFPHSELYGLTSQLRRSASSIPANIAEGFYRNSTKELIQFIYNARGSLGETKYHIRLATDLGYISDTIYSSLVEEYDSLGKQLNGWIKSLKAKITK